MFLDTRELEKDLAVVFKLLDVGSDDAELVDTGAEHVCGAADAVFDLLLEGSLGSLVVFAAFNLILEDDGEVAGRIKLTVFLAEYCHVVVGTGGFHHRVGAVDGSFEIGVAFGVCHGAENVGDRDLKRHVHAAFEVEAEANSEFLGLGVGVAQPDCLTGNRIDVVLVSFRVGIADGIGIA